MTANIFDDFVKNFTKDFGIQNTTWKVHAVSHMVDEVKRHGVLLSHFQNNEILESTVATFRLLGFTSKFFFMLS